MTLESISKIIFTGEPTIFSNPTYGIIDIVHLRDTNKAMDLVKLNAKYKPGLGDKLENIVFPILIGINTLGELMIKDEDQFALPCPPRCKEKGSREQLISYTDAKLLVRNFEIAANT